MSLLAAGESADQTLEWQWKNYPHHSLRCLLFYLQLSTIAPYLLPQLKH